MLAGAGAGTFFVFLADPPDAPPPPAVDLRVGVLAIVFRSFAGGPFGAIFPNLLSRSLVVGGFLEGIFVECAIER